MVPMLMAGCGGSEAEPADAAPADAPIATIDADLPGPADAALVMVRVTGNVQFNGPVAGATVELLRPASATTTTNAGGDFTFDVGEGVVVVVKATAPGVRPMIRGWRATQNHRVRVFYMLGPEEEAGIGALGHDLDADKGILEIDFRNAAIGGYGVTLTQGDAGVAPGFGVALDDDGVPMTSQVTLAGGGGSTLFLGDVPTGELSFTPIVPGEATLPCQPCDALPIPVQPGVVTWWDFECGTAEDCL